jgi:5,5'-dehydrodivanillate O-demethylase
MLTAEENERLTRVGPGTPMGDLMRRYWQPLAATSELADDYRIKPLRLLGEDLVLYRDYAGTYGLIERWCAHRGTDLSMGRVEDCGIRCMRHGWIYMETGQCLDMPLEEEPFAADVKMNGYPVAEAGGLLWGYLGPLPAPLVPDWAPFHWQDGLTQIVYADLPCNWLQCQESALDPIAIEWLQAYTQSQMQMAQPPGTIEFDFDEFEHGYVYKRKDGGAWSIGRTALWPNGLFAGDEHSARLEWHVPTDETHTRVFMRFFDKAAPGTRLPKERTVAWYANLKDDDNDEWLSERVLNRTFTIWLEQGAVLDRTREHLVDSDRGLNILRDKYTTQMSLIADGAEPKAVLRDPEANRRLRLPDSKARVTPSSADGTFPYLEGQPDPIARTYHRVVQSWLPPEQRTKPKRRRAKPKAEPPYNRSY